MDKYTKHLDVRIDATKSYFEAKFGCERNKYAAKLAEFDTKFKQHVTNMNQKMENLMQQNIECVVQNKIKEKLVLSSTEKIMSEITNPSYADSIINNIVNENEVWFEQKIVDKLAKKIVFKVLDKAKTHLKQSFISEISSIKKEQEQID